MKFNFKIISIFHIFIWFSLSALFNVCNKIALNSLPLPWFMAAIQSTAGLLVNALLCFVSCRQYPVAINLSQMLDTALDFKFIAVISIFSNVSGTLSSSLGSVPFAQTVKATEAIFTAAVSLVLRTDYLSSSACIALMIAVCGTVYMSLGEMSFSWLSLTAALASNLFAALRSVMSKQRMNSTRMSAEEYCTVMSFVSLALLLPCVCLFEGRQLGALWTECFWRDGERCAERREGLGYLVLSGVLFSLYTEFSFQVLSKCSPVAHSVLNTLRRVVVIAAAVALLGSSITAQSIVGSFITLLGVLMYAISV